MITYLQSLPNGNESGFINASNSMYSEAFLRYKPSIYRRIFYNLLEKQNFLNISEIKALGRFFCIDGSIFPAIKNMIGASYKTKMNAIKLHLSFALSWLLL